nr:hypothetical protein [Hafnia paralvei]
MHELSCGNRIRAGDSGQAGDANSRDGGMNNGTHIFSDEAGRDIESHFLFMQID